MKRNIMLSILIFTASFAVCFSQLVPKWEIGAASFTHNEYRYDGYQFNKIAGTSENDIIVLGQSYNAENGYFPAIWRFKNKADEREILYTDTTKQDKGPDIATHEFRSIAKPAHNYIIAVGDSNKYQGEFKVEGKFGEAWQEFYFRTGFMLISTDGGESWNKTTLDSNTKLNEVRMLDNDYGVILEEGWENYYNQRELINNDTLLITKDGWKTYEQIKLPETIEYPDDIFILSKDTLAILCWDADTKRTFIIFSYDGGKNWEDEFYFDETVRIQDIEFIGNKAYAVGWYEPSLLSDTVTNPYVDISVQFPYIAYSENRGRSWRKLESFPVEINDIIKDYGHRLYSVDFCDSINGIVSGFSDSANPYVFKTTDGGESWEREYLPFSYHNQALLMNIYFPRKNYALVFNQSRYVYKYEGDKLLAMPKFYKFSNVPIENLKLRWASIEGAKNYRIKIDSTRKWFSESTGIKTYPEPDFESPIIDTTIADTSVLFEKLMYESRIVAFVKAIGESRESYWRRYIFVTNTRENYLYQPKFVFPKSVTIIRESRAEFKWRAVKPATKYYLTIENKANREVIFRDTLSAVDTSVVVIGFEPNTGYMARLEATRGNESSGDLAFFITATELPVRERKEYEPITSLRIYPNPTYSSINLSVNLKSRSKIEIDLINSWGSKIDRIFGGYQTDGCHTFRHAPEPDLPSGTYWIRATIDGEKQVAKPVVILK